MEIIQITRKVTGSNYSNIELTATISNDDNPLECALNLDKEARNILYEIEKVKTEEIEREDNKDKFRMTLQRIIKKMDNGTDFDDMPF